MRSQALQSGDLETSVRKVRTFLTDLMEAAGDTSEIPAISRRIRTARERRQEEWEAENGTGRGNPYTQEAMARQLEVSLSGYGNWERGRTEPTLARLRQIAVALGLDEDYFSPTGDLASATARVEAEADRLAELREDLQELLPVLRSLVEEKAQRGSQSEPG